MAEQEKSSISIRQLKAARQLLGWTQRQLAEAAGVAERTVIGLEAGETVPHNSTMKKILDALAARGIEFTNGGMPGVRVNPKKAILPE
jgi:transcriptional regulator with XRE-family HTH domain